MEGGAVLKTKKSQSLTRSPINYDVERFSVELGRKIKALRLLRGLTLRDMVQKHDFHVTQIQRIEKGTGITFGNVLRICEALQTPIEVLVAGIAKETSAVRETVEAGVNDKRTN